jgi:hypothetical protein
VVAPGWLAELAPCDDRRLARMERPAHDWLTGWLANTPNTPGEGEGDGGVAKKNGGGGGGGGGDDA